MCVVNKNRGFTLIELLVSISIISLLASITFSNLYLARVRARDGLRLSHIRIIIQALQVYNLDKGVWPNITILNDPANLYSNGSQICNSDVSEGFTWTRCNSRRYCQAPLPCIGNSCEQYWLPPLDHPLSFFSANSAPHDPDDQSCPPAVGAVGYSYLARSEPGSNPEFRLIYTLERANPLAQGRLLSGPGCVTDCVYMVIGDPDGSIRFN